MNDLEETGLREFLFAELVRLFEALRPADLLLACVWGGMALIIVLALWAVWRDQDRRIAQSSSRDGAQNPVDRSRKGL